MMFSVICGSMINILEHHNCYFTLDIDFDLMYKSYSYKEPVDEKGNYLKFILIQTLNPFRFAMHLSE